MMKVVLDTNVCGKLLTPAYCDDVADIKARISRTFKLAISPQTFLELLDALTKSDSAHFESHRARLRLMAGGGKPVFLRFPAAFALKTAAGISRSPAPGAPREIFAGYGATAPGHRRGRGASDEAHEGSQSAGIDSNTSD
jgi:hypothetical protein